MWHPTYQLFYNKLYNRVFTSPIIALIFAKYAYGIRHTNYSMTSHIIKCLLALNIFYKNRFSQIHCPFLLHKKPQYPTQPDNLLFPSTQNSDAIIHWIIAMTFTGCQSSFAYDYNSRLSSRFCAILEAYRYARQSSTG